MLNDFLRMKKIWLKENNSLYVSNEDELLLWDLLEALDWSFSALVFFIVLQCLKLVLVSNNTKERPYTYTMAQSNLFLLDYPTHATNQRD
jgi:hypothetical protein